MSSRFRLTARSVSRSIKYAKPVTSHDLILTLILCYGLEADIRPIGQTTKAFKNAYQVVNSEYLEENAVPRSKYVSLRLWEEAQLKKLLVLTITPPAHPSTLPVLHEVNESQGQIRRESLAGAARARASPSEGAVVRNRMKTQTPSRQDAVYNFRPLDLAARPIAIYHPVFAHFLSIMANLEDTELTHEELERAQWFVNDAVDFYGVEARRIKAYNGEAVHPTILESITLTFASGTLQSNGRVASIETPDCFLIIPTIREVKEDVGTGACDPNAQAECDYARTIREVCCCPALLIGMPGPHIIVSGAVFADRLIVENLTDYISVVPRSSEIGRTALDDAGYRVARLFRALRICVAELDNYYRTVVGSYFGPQRGVRPRAAVAARPAPSFIGPHFTRYRESGEDFILTNSTGPEPVHAMLEAASLAPKLRHCAFEPDVGLWVIVMDCITEEARELTSPVHVESLRTAVVMVHERGFVFGDLRRPNLFVMCDRVVLFGFDWCGKDGEARYPSNIVLVDERDARHETVKRGGLITKGHDAYQFEYLTGQPVHR
ncbi:hypothetical protein C8Q74DRAFT_1363768 [Fomes fomentarius]|nr:hypothetical protein C8Q74DRAFT_1363768 [Fomes fomentarius]